MMFAVKNEEHSVSAIGSSLIDTYHLWTLSDTKEMVYYSKDEGRHKKNAEDVVRKTVRQQVNRNISNHELNEIVTYIKDMTKIDRSEFDMYPNILNVRNGLLNMDTGELSPHSPEYLSFVQFPVEYDPNASWAPFIQFLDAVVDKENKIRIVQMLGDLLVKGHVYETMFFLFGTGGNGKGTLGYVLEKFVGEENCCALTPHQIADNKFARANLFGKRLNFGGDVGDNAIEHWDVLRSLTSPHDRIYAEFKGVNGFTFPNEAKMVFAFNKLPAIPDDYSTWRRIQLIEFPKTFSPKDMNRDLKAELTTSKVLSGILNLALGGRKSLIKSNEHNKASIKEIKLAYKRLQDHVVGFIHDCYIIDAEGSVPTEKVKTRYDAYCREKGLTPLSANALGAKLIDAGLEHRRTRSITKGKLVPVYAGIREREGQKLC